MGLNQSIPGVDWRGRLQNLKLFGVRSTDATGLLTPFRNEALSIYKLLNKALAEYVTDIHIFMLPSHTMSMQK
jgi:hypothetical protein